MSATLKDVSVACALAIALSGCMASTPNVGSSSMVYVGPSKGWYKPGVNGKEAYAAWQQCLADAKQQPEYLALKEEAASVRIRQDMSKEEMRRMFADNAFIGRYDRECMTSKGFRYMKYPAGEQVYVPPRPPEKGWQKPGVSPSEAMRAKGRCLDQEYSQEYLNRCMGEQGFVYDVLSRDGE